MKATLKVYSMMIAVACCSLQTMAGDLPQVEKKKTYSKTYAMGANDRLKLENKFGEMNITTWDRAEVSVEVVMTAKGNDEERATYLLDRLSVNDGKTSEGVWFETEIKDGDKKYKNTNYKDEGFSINYTVKMPAKATLNASNEFGSTTIADFAGLLDLSSKFGDLKTGRLTNVRKVKVEFGTASIASISNGSLEIKFSRAVVDNMDGSVNARFEHCGGVKLNLANDIKKLTVKNEFTNLFLNVNKDLSANFQINTHFGELKNRTAFSLLTEKDDDEDRNHHGPKFDRVYLGKSGSGNSDLRINANFSEITVGHELTMDLKADKKTARKRITNI